ncbi:MAG: hypothetical protein ACJ71G_04545 [Nitrososphaeraceae archaeon]
MYDVTSLSSVPSLSTAVLSEVISLSNLSGLIAIFPGSCSAAAAERFHQEIQDITNNLKMLKEEMK